MTIFVVVTFAITFFSWWWLAALVPTSGLQFDDVSTMTLYLLGGFGPTIGAYVAVLSTPAEGSRAEFHQRLLRWRVNPSWYVVAFALPPALAALSALVWASLEPGVELHPIQPLYAAATLFPIMIIGGGLEELGWRGVAQPALEHRVSRLSATLVVGVLWVAWHVPLFFIPGVGQFDANFTVFAVDTLAIAFLLAWLYGATGSILLCVLFHAAINTTGAMGLGIPDGHITAELWAAGIKLALAVAIVAATAPRAGQPSAPISARI